MLGGVGWDCHMTLRSCDDSQATFVHVAYLMNFLIEARECSS